MRIRTLGPVEVERDDVVINVGGKQQRRLLGVLVVNRGRPVSTERLVDAMWPDGEAPEGSARSMRTYLSRLRSVLPEGSIVNRHGGYMLHTDGLTIDLDDFDRLLATAEGSVPDQALGCYDEALALWRGVPFGEFTDEWWALAESQRLVERRALADEGRLTVMMVLGHHNRALPELERLVAEHPLREQPVRLLTQALQVTGRRSEALRAARAFRSRLADQTGLDPSPEFTQLESAIAADAEQSTAAHNRPLRGYTMHQAIGEGAHGRVYAATQPGTERPVAIKVIRPELADSSEFIRRFEVEARLVARLEHPHIVPLYDYWREPGGAYLVFRLLAGGTARDSVITGGPWSFARVSRFVEEIGGALMSAHAAGVVHNDVKASNVLLDDDDGAYLTDFGIAAVDVAGRDPDADAVRTDVRDLAWTTWELLAGSCPPPQVSRSSRARRSRMGPVPPLVGRLSSVPDGLDAVLARATSADDGYATVAEFLLGWRAATGRSDGQPSPITSSERHAADSARRHAVHAMHLAVTAGINPYRGLRSFDEEDATRFHGRSMATDELVDLVSTSSFVTVIGSSGSGKSSLVRAGLVPRLRSLGHAVVTLVPGDDPLSALNEALSDVTTLADVETSGEPHDAMASVARRAGKLTIVVDQFEECWTRADEVAREAFLDVVERAIADESVGVGFVATVRADLSDRPLEHPSLGHRISAGAYVLAALSPSELDEVIVSPAVDVGVGFEDGVVADLIAEAVTQPGSLPLLQFTLTELYDRRIDGAISHEALDAIGGIAGAIGRRADEVFAELDDAARADVRELFGRLVAPGDGRPDARRRARRSELSPGTQAVADRFVDTRLLTTDRDPVTREPTIEVAHEALLERWGLLAGWVAEDRRWLAQLQHLSDAARAWDADGRNNNELYRGSRLEAAIEAIDVDGRVVSEVERDFVEAGRSARDAEIRSVRRTGRRLRRLLVAAAAALVVALVATAVAVVQRSEADDNAAEAELQAALASSAADEAQIEALVGRAESLRLTQRDAAALLAVEAYRLADTPRTRSALLATFTSQPTFYDARRIPGSGGGAGMVMPDGESAYLVDGEGRVRPYVLDTGSLGDPFPAIGDVAAGTSVLTGSTDGRLLAQAWRENINNGPTTVAVFDTSTGALQFPPLVVDGAVWSATFTPDAAYLALAIDVEAQLLVVDSATGAERASAPGITVPPLGGETGAEPQVGGVLPSQRPPSVALAGDELLLGAADGSLRVFDAVTFEQRRSIALAADTLVSIRPLDDGTVLTAGRRGRSLVNPTTEEVLWQRDQGLSDIGDGASGATCRHLAVFEKRGSFYCANAYGRLAEYDLSSGYSTRVLDAQNGNTGPLWTARDGTELVSFGDNEPVVTRWRLDGSGPITHLVAPGFRGWRFNPGGDRLLVEQGAAFEGRPPQVIDVATGDVVRVLDGLINADWLDDDSVGGALLSSRGDVEGASIDLPDGNLEGNGFIIDPIPNYAGLEPGKDRYLFHYRRGTDSILRQLDGSAQRFGPEIFVDDLFSYAISRSGHRIAAGTKGGVEIHDGYTGQQVGAIPGDDLRGVFITVTDQLFVSSLGGELTLYDLDSLEPIRTFGGSRGFITQVLGTADGTLIATIGGDHNVILYDVASGVRIGTPITIPDEESNLIVLSLDGRRLSVGGEAADGSHATKIWDLDPASWTAAACRVAGRNLTREEWASNIGDIALYRATCPDLPMAP